ncbi:MAG: hypothetical protein ACRDYB_05035 [Acidimicrobiales bacterium]
MATWLDDRGPDRMASAISELAGVSSLSAAHSAWTGAAADPEITPLLTRSPR